MVLPGVRGQRRRALLSRQDRSCSRQENKEDDRPNDHHHQNQLRGHPEENYLIILP